MALHDTTSLLARRPADYHWTHPAGPLSLPHYESAINLLADRARAVPGLLGVYDLGPIRYPGLSDVDLVFVVEDAFANFSALRPLLREAVPAAFHDVLLHDPYFIRRTDLDGFLQFAPIFQYHAIWTDSTLPSGGGIESPLDRTLFLADIVAESYPREFIQFLLSDTLDSRALLGRLKGLAYCFNLLAGLGGQREEPFERYAAAITELREKFFEIPQPELESRVLQLSHEAIGLSHALALRTRDLLASLWGLRVEGRLDLACTNTPAIFAESVPEALPRYGAVRLRRMEVFPVAPAALGWLVREYAREAGPFSARLRARISDRLNVLAAPPAEILQAIHHRARLRNAHTAWADASGLGLSGFLTFGYRMHRKLSGPRALKELLGRATDRARETLLRRQMAKTIVDPLMRSVSE